MSIYKELCGHDCPDNQLCSRGLRGPPFELPNRNAGVRETTTIDDAAEVSSSVTLASIFGRLLPLPSLT